MFAIKVLGWDENIPVRLATVASAALYHYIILPLRWLSICENGESLTLN